MAATERPDPPAKGVPTWAVLVLAAVLVFAVAVAGLEWRRAHDLDATASSRQRALAVAGALGEDLFTYNYTDLQATQDRILRLASPAYAQRESASARALEANIVKLKAVGSAVIRHEYLTDVSTTSAGAIVELDTTVTGTAGNTQAVRYLQMVLVRVGSAWKVDSIATLSPTG